MTSEVRGDVRRRVGFVSRSPGVLGSVGAARWRCAAICGSVAAEVAERDNADGCAASALERLCQAPEAAQDAAARLLQSG